MFLHRSGLLSRNERATLQLSLLVLPLSSSRFRLAPRFGQPLLHLGHEQFPQPGEFHFTECVASKPWQPQSSRYRDYSRIESEYRWSYFSARGCQSEQWAVVRRLLLRNQQLHVAPRHARGSGCSARCGNCRRHRRGWSRVCDSLDHAAAESQGDCFDSLRRLEPRLTVGRSQSNSPGPQGRSNPRYGRTAPYKARAKTRADRTLHDIKVRHNRNLDSFPEPEGLEPANHPVERN